MESFCTDPDIVAANIKVCLACDFSVRSSFEQLHYSFLSVLPKQLKMYMLVLFFMTLQNCYCCNFYFPCVILCDF